MYFYGMRLPRLVVLCIGKFLDSYQLVHQKWDQHQMPTIEEVQLIVQMSSYDNGNVIRLFRTMYGLSGQALLRSDAKLVPQLFYDGEEYTYSWCIHDGRGGQVRVPNAKE